MLEAFNFIGALVGIISGVMAILGVEGLLKWKKKIQTGNLQTNAPAPPILQQSPAPIALSKTLNVWHPRLRTTILVASILYISLGLISMNYLTNNFAITIIIFGYLIAFDVYLIKQAARYHGFYLKFRHRFLVSFLGGTIVLLAGIIATYVFFGLFPALYEEMIEKQIRELTSELAKYNLPEEKLSDIVDKAREDYYSWTFRLISLIVCVVQAAIIAVISAAITIKRRTAI